MPEAITVIWPAAAFLAPPETGPSIRCTPCSASRLAHTGGRAGSTVAEVTTTALGRSDWGRRTTRPAGAQAAHSQAATQAVRQLERAIEQKIKQLTVLVEQQQLESLFHQLTNMDLTAEHLPAEYRDVFAKGHSEPLSRQQLTLALEIVCEKPSPPADQAQRQQVQLMLLSDKHNAGQLLDKQSLFKRWLSLGAVKAEEQALLSRVKVLFI